MLVGIGIPIRLLRIGFTTMFVGTERVFLANLLEQLLPQKSEKMFHQTMAVQVCMKLATWCILVIDASVFTCE